MSAMSDAVPDSDKATAHRELQPLRMNTRGNGKDCFGPSVIVLQDASFFVVLQNLFRLMSDKTIITRPQIESKYHW